MLLSGSNVTSTGGGYCFKDEYLIISLCVMLFLYMVYSISSGDSEPVKQLLDFR